MISSVLDHLKNRQLIKAMPWLAIVMMKLTLTKIYANLIQGAQLKILENEGHHSLIKNRIEKILKSICV